MKSEYVSPRFICNSTPEIFIFLFFFPRFGNPSTYRSRKHTETKVRGKRDFPLPDIDKRPQQNRSTISNCSRQDPSKHCHKPDSLWASQRRASTTRERVLPRESGGQPHANLPAGTTHHQKLLMGQYRESVCSPGYFISGGKLVWLNSNPRQAAPDWPTNTTGTRLCPQQAESHRRQD